MKYVFFVFAMALPSWGAVTLSNIIASDVGQHYCRVVGDVSPDAYVQVHYGVTPGGPYPYDTYPYLTGQQITPSDSGVFALDMGALASGTIYYYVVQARPNINNANGQIQSPQGTCTTTTGSPYPVAPTGYQPAYPVVTSGYTTISLVVSGGVYVAASTVNHTGGVFCASDPAWKVTAGDTIPKILSEINFGAIIEFPQSTTGGVPDTNNYNGGFILPGHAVDPCSTGMTDPNHRWVLSRTRQVGASDFPPFGADNIPFRTGPTWAAKLATLQAQQPTSVLYTSGQIFTAVLETASALPIHHYWFSNLEFSVNSASSNGPWGPYFTFGNGEGNSYDAANPPSYIVLDRLYFLAATPPAFSVVGVSGTVGANVAILGSYIVGFQRSNDIGQGIYIEDCSTGPLSIINNEVDAAGMGIYFESVSMTACGERPPVIMQNVVVAKNSLYEPPSWLNPINAGYGTWDWVQRGPFRNPFESKNCQVCLITGNWIDGSFSGQNSGEAILITPVRTANRQMGATGSHDLEISWNYVRHAAVFADVWGTTIIDGCCGYAPDAALNSNVLMDNNLALDLGRFLYTIQGTGAGLYSNYFNSYGVQNHLIINNTLGFTNADSGTSGFYYIPHILGTSDGGISSNGFQFAGNLLYFSQGVTGNTSSGIIAASPVCPGGCATFPVAPLPNTATYATSLHSSMVQIGQAVTSSSIWGGNVVICGNKATGAEPWPDMTSGDCSAQAANMPTGDIYPQGNTMAARQVAAGLLNVENADFTLTPNANNFGGTVGANIPGVLAALGIVKNISVLPGQGTLQFSYTAPDTNACAVDTSPDGSTWTRSSASGGSRIQTILVTALNPSTAYQYRLLCYYSQSRPWFSFPSEPTNMATEGTSTTTAPPIQVSTPTLIGIFCPSMVMITPTSTTCTIALVSAAPVGGLSIPLSSNSLSLTEVPSVVVGAGQKSASFTLTAATVSTNQTAILTAGSGSTRSVTLVLVAPALLTGLACSPSTLNSGTSITCTVSLNNATPIAAVISLSSNNALLSVPGSVMVPAGQSGASFQVTAGNLVGSQSALIAAGFKGVMQSVTLGLNLPAVPTAVSVSKK